MAPRSSGAEEAPGTQGVAFLKAVAAGKAADSSSSRLLQVGRMHHSSRLAREASRATSQKHPTNVVEADVEAGTEDVATDAGGPRAAGMNGG